MKEYLLEIGEVVPGEPIHLRVITRDDDAADEPPTIQNHFISDPSQRNSLALLRQPETEADRRVFYELHLTEDTGKHFLARMSSERDDTSRKQMEDVSPVEGRFLLDLLVSYGVNEWTHSRDFAEYADYPEAIPDPIMRR